MSQTDRDYYYSPESFRQLNISFEDDNDVLWLHMKPKGRGCFTVGLLSELKRYQQGLLKWRGHYYVDQQLVPVKYEVLASELEGIFNYGGDLELFLRAIKNNDRDTLLSYGIACIDVVFPNSVNYNLPITTISLVRGDALGGGLEAALSSSVVVAERGVNMGFPEIMFGLFPGMGAYSLLTRRVSPSVAKKIISGGQVYSSEEFYEMGIVDQLAEKGKGIEAVNSFITKHVRHHKGYCAIDNVVKQENPVNYEHLYKVVELWVETALNLSKKELRVMERLAKAQIQKNTDIVNGETIKENYTKAS